VERGGEWREWWRSSTAPDQWSAPLAAVAGAVGWRAAAPGLSWGELRLAGTGEAWRLRVILVRLDPARVRLRLHAAVRADGRAGPWSVDAAPAEALLALNAGQFADGGPWGWVVHRGRERRPPGTGSLAPAIVVDSGGAVRFVPADSIAAARAAGLAVEAFQSYPALLLGDGVVPPPVREPGRGVDLAHRDGRLALGELRDGTILIALTRFEGLGGALSALPFGPTVPETAALMGALGCRRAVLLDGGISGQLLVRGRGAEAQAWRGLRQVPLGLIAVPR
jgi:exopolysaccharide biosynthesis protein